MEIKFDNYQKAFLLARLNYKFSKVYDYLEYMKWRKGAVMKALKIRQQKNLERQRLTGEYDEQKRENGGTE